MLFGYFVRILILFWQIFLIFLISKFDWIWPLSSSFILLFERITDYSKQLFLKITTLTAPPQKRHSRRCGMISPFRFLETKKRKNVFNCYHVGQVRIQDFFKISKSSKTADVLTKNLFSTVFFKLKRAVKIE